MTFLIAILINLLILALFVAIVLWVIDLLAGAFGFPPKILVILKAISDRILVIETRSVTWTAALGIFFTGLQICVGTLLYYLGHK